MSKQERIGRAVRGMVEGARYEFTRLGFGLWEVASASGKSYETSQSACTCPDHAYRCSKIDGARCKHQVALDLHLSTLKETVRRFEEIFG